MGSALAVRRRRSHRAKAFSKLCLAHAEQTRKIDEIFPNA